MYNNVADINDLRFAIEFTSKCYPHAPIIPVGSFYLLFNL